MSAEDGMPTDKKADKKAVRRKDADIASAVAASSDDLTTHVQGTNAVAHHGVTSVSVDAEETVDQMVLNGQFVKAGPVSVVVKQCRICKHWRSIYGAPSLGECALSARARPSPIITQDLSSCSGWDS